METRIWIRLKFYETQYFKKTTPRVWISYRHRFPIISRFFCTNSSWAQFSVLDSLDCNSYFNYWNFEKTCDLTGAPASIYDRKTAAGRFDPIHDILRSISLAQYLLKGEICRFGSAGAEGLTYFEEEITISYHPIPDPCLV